MSEVHSTKQLTWQRNNREKCQAYSAKWYAKNKKRHAKNGAAWKKKNREKATLHHATWVEKNREHLKEYNKARRKELPEVFQSYIRTRRARKAHAPVNDFTAQQWRDMQAAYDHRCVYCGKRCKGKLTQDHITPLSKGGSHTLTNIVPACKNCNSKKHDNVAPIPVQPLLLL